MIVMYLFWRIFRALPATVTHIQTPARLERRNTNDADSDDKAPATKKEVVPEPVEIAVLEPTKETFFRRLGRFADLVDIHEVDLYRDEHAEDDSDRQDNEERERHLNGRWRLLWRAWYLIAWFEAQIRANEWAHEDSLYQLCASSENLSNLFLLRVAGARIAFYSNPKVFNEV